MKTPHGDEIRTWRLRDADGPLRMLITAFLVVLTAGYALGIFFVEHTTSGTPGGVSGEFRGTEADASAMELKFEKSPREMYTLVHNHVLSLSLLFFCVGAIFNFSSYPGPPWKTLLMAEPFVAIVTTFGGLWLLRFVDPGFVWLVIPSGFSMAACYILMVILIMKELWWRR
jgi:hypothetical protein